jgi:cyclophilin family peptidyl-prolyl cis-trans isomerase
MRHRLNASVVIVAAYLALLSCCIHPAHAIGLPSWLGGETPKTSSETVTEAVTAPAQPITPTAVTPITAAPLASDPSLPDWVIAIQQNPELARQNGAIVDTQRGSITFRFYEQDAPITVANFKRLANRDFYNASGMKFHRVVENFVVQTGDPTGTGFGGSKETIPLEAKNKRVHDTLGVVSMARGPLPDSATSQFYITLAKQASLDGKYAIFGEVVQGLEVLHQIKQGDRVYGVRLTALPTGSEEATPPLQDRKAFAKQLEETEKLAKRETKNAEKLAAKEANKQQQEAFKRRETEQRLAAEQEKRRANETANQLAQQAKAASVQTSSSAKKSWWKVY